MWRSRWPARGGWIRPAPRISRDRWCSTTEPAFVAALDVGGTTIKGALSGPDGGLIDCTERPTGREDGPEAILERVAGFAAELTARGARAVGIAVPGLIDEQAGVVREAVNLGWHDVALRRLLGDRLDLPVAVGHDVRTAGLAERVLGAARDVSSAVFVPVGTGIAAALLLSGEAYPGAHGFAGELGHLTVDPDGPQCACGKRGCAETLASAAAVENRYRERADSGERVTARTVARRALEGDAIAAAVWDEAVDALGYALAAAICLLDPELVLVGGGLAEAGPQLLEPLRTATRRWTLPAMDLPPIEAAALGSDAGCHGAAIRAWREAGHEVSPS